MEAFPKITPERAPDSASSPRRAVVLPSCPKRASDSEPCPKWAPAPVDSPKEGSCPWVQPHKFPQGFFLWGWGVGGSRAPAVVAGPRDKATATKTACHGLLSSLLRHGLLSSLLCHGPLSSLIRHGLLSSLIRHGALYCLFHPGGVPFVPVLHQPPGCPPAHPPSPVVRLRRGTRLLGGGVMSRLWSVLVLFYPGLSSCFLIWSFSCPCSVWLWFRSAMCD